MKIRWKKFKFKVAVPSQSLVRWGEGAPHLARKAKRGPFAWAGRANSADLWSYWQRTDHETEKKTPKTKALMNNQPHYISFRLLMVILRKYITDVPNLWHVGHIDVLGWGQITCFYFQHCAVRLGNRGDQNSGRTSRFHNRNQWNDKPDSSSILTEVGGGRL